MIFLPRGKFSSHFSSLVPVILWQRVRFVDTEDGPIGARYQLRETPSANYAQRTEWNVRDSNGTVVFSIDPELTGGSKKTVLLAHKHGRPVLYISRNGGPRQPEQALLQFIREHGICQR